MFPKKWPTWRTSQSGQCKKCFTNLDFHGSQKWVPLINSSYLSNIAIFHFHDYGGKSNSLTFHHHLGCGSWAIYYKSWTWMFRPFGVTEVAIIWPEQRTLKKTNNAGTQKTNVWIKHGFFIPSHFLLFLLGLPWSENVNFNPGCIGLIMQRWLEIANHPFVPTNPKLSTDWGQNSTWADFCEFRCSGLTKKQIPINLACYSHWNCWSKNQQNSQLPKMKYSI